MNDPSPLVAHVYDSFIDFIFGDKGSPYVGHVHGSFIGVIFKDGFEYETHFKSLYRESRIPLPGSYLHNQFINYYNHGKDPNNTHPVYFPSKAYIFKNLRYNLSTDLSKLSEHTESYVSIWDSFLSGWDIVCQISYRQPFTYFILGRVSFTNNKLCFPRLSNVVQVFHISGTILPPALESNLIQQISELSSLRALDLDFLELAETDYVTLKNKATSLTELVLLNVKMKNHACKQILEEIQYLTKLQKLLVRIKGSDSLEYCNIPHETCSDFLGSLSNLKELTELDLSVNNVSGCLSNLIPSPSLVELQLRDTSLNSDDINHFTYLLKEQTIPKLEVLKVSCNNLMNYEGEVELLLKAIKTHHHRELQVFLGSLPGSFLCRMKREYEGTHVKLYAGDRCP